MSRTSPDAEPDRGRARRRRFAPRARQTLALGTLATSVTLAGCGEPAPDFERFTSVDQCATSGFSRDVCEAEYGRALAAHIETAPRFDGRAACEAEYGEGSCSELPAQPSQAGQPQQSFFVPFLTGYLVSSALSRITTPRGYSTYYNNNPGYRPSPIYRTRTGTDVTVTRDANNQAVTRPVNQNTRTVARRGFGGSGFSRSRGFGG